MLEKDRDDLEMENELDEDEEIDDSPVEIEDVHDDIESLDSIKKKFEKQGLKDGYINQEDLLDATQRLDLNDDDIESLIKYFQDKNIKVISDTDDEQDFDNMDASEEELEKMDNQDDLTEVFEDDSGDFSDGQTEDVDTSALDFDNDLYATDSSKINDPVKMYLKQIGCYKLLTSQEEIESLCWPRYALPRFNSRGKFRFDESC